MTQTGKCDTCRARKVKCDEEKPKCSACRKKDRPCTYSYGKASAFVVQDPNQLTKHGKSKVASVIYPLESSESAYSTPLSAPASLHITTERAAENGQGFFQTLAPMTRRKLERSRKAAAHQRRQLALYLQHLQAESAIASVRPSSPETTLIARYIDMLGPEPAGKQPLSILGTWIQSIPARIGSNPMMDLAVEFMVNSYAVYWDDTYSKRSAARASKEKALKELQLVVFRANSQPTYDVLLATKMHYAAEAIMGIDTMYHAIHAFGLAELLKSGVIANVDDEHYWNLIDNTYIDDVNEAILAGRKSVYDNNFYLSSTYPPPLSSDEFVLSPSQRASMAIMHIFVQCPRLNCLIRQAVTQPDDTDALVSAVTLAESLWQLDLAEQVSPLLNTAIITVPIAPVADLADIMTESLQYDSVQDMILCTRYWMLINVLGGLTDTLYRHYPSEAALSLLPGIDMLRQTECDAAIQLAKSLPWAKSISQKLPLVPLRFHTPLQISLGPWCRTIRRLTAIDPDHGDLSDEFEYAAELSRARRMKTWLIEECNKIHRQWDVSTVSEKPLLEALDSMAGEKIPDWLPVRVRFEAEDGEMVMKLDYQNKTGSYQERFDLSEETPRNKERDALVWAEAHGAQGPRFQELPDRTSSAGGLDLVSGHFGHAYKSDTMDPRDAANFIHETGRNLCSTSGWWPTSGNASQLRVDSTHQVTTFSGVTPNEPSEDTEWTQCQESIFWATPATSPRSPSDSPPKNVCLSPAWLSPRWLSPRPGAATTMDNRKGSAFASPAWTSVKLTSPTSFDASNSLTSGKEIDTQ